MQGFEVGKLARDATHLYWTEADGLARMPLSGGERELVASDQLSPTYLAIDGDELYWINHGRRGTSMNVASSIVKMKLPSGAPQVLADQLLRDNLFRTFAHIQTDETWIYLLETGTPQSLYRDGAINQLGKEGGTLTSLVSGLRSPGKLAHDESHFFVGWAHSNNDGAIESYTRDGLGPTMLDVAGRGFSDLVLEGDFLFYAHKGTEIRRVPKTGGPYEVMAEASSTGATLSCLQVDDGQLYWAESLTTGKVFTRPLDSPHLTELASDYAGKCASMVVSESGVYWSNESGVLFMVRR